MDSLYTILLAIISICRGVVRATRSMLASSASDSPEAKSLLPQTRTSVKKRQKKTSSVDQMGTAGQILDTPQPDVMECIGPAGRLSHSLPMIQETFSSITIQVFIPLFVAGIGMVGAGLYLDKVSNWEVFVEVPELIVLIPALLGLKGNLEMTLASRLSTEANVGNMDDNLEMWRMILGNLMLVQCQATVVGLLSSVVAELLVAGFKFHMNMPHALLLCACSTLTASVASLLLGVATSAVIVISKKFHINPDNIATPLAGSLGDITSLAFLSIFADFFYKNSDSFPHLPLAVILVYLAAMPFWFWVCKNNKYTKAVLYNGWTPVITAMLISTLGGMILGKMLDAHEGVAVFQPVINGVGGNIVSIQASRLSTALHQQGELGELPDSIKIWISPEHAFLSNTPHALTARVLMFLMLPGHIIFAYIIDYFQFSDKSLSLVFLVSYLIAASIQVAVLLYAAYVLTHHFWVRKINPDNSTIPYLTAIGDVLGIILLGLTFEFLDVIKQPMLH